MTAFVTRYLDSEVTGEGQVQGLFRAGRCENDVITTPSRDERALLNPLILFEPEPNRGTNRVVSSPLLTSSIPPFFSFRPAAVGVRDVHEGLTPSRSLRPHALSRIDD